MVHLGPTAFWHTYCCLLVTPKYARIEVRDVNCPDCLFEFKQQEYFRQLKFKLQAPAPKRALPRRGRRIRSLDLLTNEQLDRFGRLKDMPGTEHCWKCDYFGCAVVGRHLGPLIIGTPDDDINEEIQMMLANPRLLAERRRQTDAFLGRGPNSSRGSIEL